jgi:LPXTG-motif cell wall-anchored protein
MKIRALFLPALLATATFAAPAMAGQQILLPNGVNVNYEGTTAPQFLTVSGPETYFEAYDSGLDAYFVYSQTGTWLGVSGSGAANVPNVPAIPTEVTLPPSPGNATGLTIPYAGQGIPTVTLDAQGNYLIIDAVAHGAQVLDPTGSFLGGGGWGSGAPTTGSSGFGSNPIGASSTSSNGSCGLNCPPPSSSGTPTTSGVVGTTSGTPTTSGVTDSFCVSNCFTGGGTDVPAPAMFGLFGMAAGGLAIARRRRRKTA